METNQSGILTNAQARIELLEKFPKNFTTDFFPVGKSLSAPRYSISKLNWISFTVES